jgi:hypothetical protein
LVQVTTERDAVEATTGRVGIVGGRWAELKFAWAGVLLGAVALASLAAGCSSASKSSTVTPTSSTSGSSMPSTAPTTGASSPHQNAASRLPTVPNCGGGAYEPKTLLIVCGSGSAATAATEVSWAAWDKSEAHGSGRVTLQVDGRPTSAPATLRLSTVVNGPVGPQFTVLTVTWQGGSPDGKTQDTYRLQLGG